MATGLARRSLASRLTRARIWSIQRPFSTTFVREQTRFSYALPSNEGTHFEELFQTLREKKALENPDSHNAAVLLTTPDFAKDLQNERFLESFAKSMAASANIDNFHMLAAVVDHVAPPIGSFKPLRGISVLRGNIDDILPQLWQPEMLKSKDDADSVSALTFNLGDPSVTLPLARTTFHNNRDSTLFTSQFEFSNGTPRLIKHAETHSQKIRLSLPGNFQSIADLDIRVPLVPLTRPRAVTESFGNIIRGIEVDGRTIPASTELEEAVNMLHKQNAISGVISGPIGVWALVTPCTDASSTLSEWLDEGPDPLPSLPHLDDVKQIVTSTTKHLQQLYSHGGRLYKILSGGGGWGAKKGLLSLDPQQTHFTPSEEDEMNRFMDTINDSGFTPKGSRIQFYMSAPALPDITEPFEPGVVFGVQGGELAPDDPEPLVGFIGQHFGALSTQAVYITGSGLPGSKETKLSVPHSRIFGREPSTGRSVFADIFGGLTDVGAISLVG